VQDSLPLGSIEKMSSVVEEDHLYSCFSPCGGLVEACRFSRLLE
jgi:hypothetical protein